MHFFVEQTIGMLNGPVCARNLTSPSKSLLIYKKYQQSKKPLHEITKLLKSRSHKYKDNKQLSEHCELKVFT